MTDRQKCLDTAQSMNVKISWMLPELGGSIIHIEAFAPEGFRFGMMRTHMRIVYNTPDLTLEDRALWWNMNRILAQETIEPCPADCHCREVS